MEERGGARRGPEHELPSGALLAAAQAGDPAAFRALIARLRPRLYGFLLRMSRQPEAAEELVQEALLRLVTRLDTLPQGTCVEAWVFTVARNLLVSWRRRETLGVNKLLQIFATRVATPAPDPLTACEGNEASVRIERALGDLRPPDRELLLLAAEGFAPSELADLLGLRPEAARQRLARARARLAEALERTPKGGRT